ncbi:DUF2790 domain-containing protein [Azotobacter vinelandii]|uniref:DUF2790 domain-containing protein n=1 Tax=Azotobacter vinelandii TaxID=354 RepID=UPI0026655EB7|nr:DUF2790 domain-containing protein [Azotobacter vinelandii]WKN19774.1 DUF2790 domain-containing protein [Azotobacter vinelandii]
MKRLATLMMAVVPFMAMSNIVDAAQKEPDPLAADLQLIAPYKSTDDGRIVDDYKYGDNLDIHKVISVESDSRACGLTPAIMTYEDSHGERHIVRYETVGAGCNNS